MGCLGRGVAAAGALGDILLQRGTAAASSGSFWLRVLHHSAGTHAKLRLQPWPILLLLTLLCCAAADADAAEWAAAGTCGGPGAAEQEHHCTGAVAPSLNPVLRQR